MNCACGRPLHYTDPETERYVTHLSEAYGENIVISVPDVGSWKVQRHYVALHGLKANDLPWLAVVMGFEQVS